MAYYVRMVYGDEDADEIRFGEGALTTSGITNWTSYLIASSAQFDMQDGGSCDICFDGSDVYVVWMEIHSITKFYLKFAKSIDGGITWDSPIIIMDTDVEPDFDNIYCPRIRMDSEGRLVLLFAPMGGSRWEAWLYVSEDGGDTWPTNTIVDTDCYAGCDLALDSNDNIYVCFWALGDYVIHCRKSTDHGSSFGSSVLASTDIGVATLWPAIEVDAGDNIHLVVGDYTAKRPYHWVSTDGGASFSSSHRLDDVEVYQDGFYSTFHLAPDDEEIHVFWWDSSWDLRYSHSSDNGASWDSSVVIFTPTDTYVNPLEMGPRSAILGGEILLYTYCGRLAPYLHVGSLTSSNGVDWTEATVFDYPEGSQWIQNACDVYEVAPTAVAVTHFMLA